MEAIILGFVRHAMTAGGGALIAGGYFTDGQWLDAAGASVTLTGLILSAIKNRKPASAR